MLKRLHILYSVYNAFVGYLENEKLKLQHESPKLRWHHPPDANFQ